MIELVRFTRSDHQAGHRVYINVAQVTHVYRHSSGSGAVICLASSDEGLQSQVHVSESLREVVGLLTGRPSERDPTEADSADS